ncbi:MAG: RNA methyltransferase [Thermoanaerobaculales bacterium]
MTVRSLILVEPAQPGNLGAAMRVAANFGVPRMDLVRSSVDPEDPEVLAWSCGADQRLEVRRSTGLLEAAADCHTLVATASSRGRQNLPVLTPRDGVPILTARGLSGVGLVFGNETRGLRREDLDRCDLVIRIPTEESFPVLNLAQAIAVLLGVITIAAETVDSDTEEPAPQTQVDALMNHLRASLLTIGFLDPKSPQRILRKLRRIFGRAGITENEVTILRGICRQMEWAARTRPERFDWDSDAPEQEQPPDSGS